MCAINGFTFSDRNLMARMNDVTRHRGPDDTGIFVNAHVTLGHNRLSIIDPSPKGHQPMHNLEGNLTVVFNGEIYNFRELRKELKGSYRFQTDSDTEIILAAFQVWGERFVERLNGIFTFAIWNERNQSLFLARDHVGVKPLYYAYDNTQLIFSSEIKGLLACGVSRAVDHEAIGHYFRLLYVPFPRTLFKHVRKFPPAHFAWYRNGHISFTRYWNPSHEFVQRTKQETREEIQKHVAAAVTRQLVSDKPLGVYLSGGIDSSIVLDAMQTVHSAIDTFSVGFDLTREEQYEKFNADFFLARETAKYYRTNHHEVLVAPHEVIDLFERSVWHSDEPIANPTALARLKLAHFAKQYVDVVLAGDGGDELFGGYERYRMSHAADRWQRVMPKILREQLVFSTSVQKLNTRAGIERYALFMFQKSDLLQSVIDSRYVTEKTHDYFKEHHFQSYSPPFFTHALLEADRETWLVDESLTLSDKMSMASGVELRVPFLDPRVVEFSETMSSLYKVNLFDTKILLKQAYREKLPAYLFHQPKRGWFSPSAKWLRHPNFYQFAREVLSPGYYEKTQDLFQWEHIETILAEHYEKRQYHVSILWALMTFQLWARRFSVEI